jgi:tetratricopeptide (TPR) repeat protein
MSAEAHTSLAYGSMIYDWNWRAAEENFGKAISANPNYATAHHWYADFLAGRGRLDESLQQMARAHELDPLSRVISSELAWVHFLRHDTRKAQDQVQRTLELDQNYAHAHFMKGLIQIQAGDAPGAIASLQHAVALGDFYPQTIAALGYAYAAAGNHKAALGVIDDLRKRSSSEYVPPFAYAYVYAGLGDVTKGVDWLLKGLSERDIFMPENFYDPLLDPLRRDPRFAKVMEGMGLAGTT